MSAVGWRFRSRKLWVYGSLSIVALMLSGGCQTGFGPSTAAQQAGPRAPNVVFFLTDDQRYDTLEFMPTVQRELVSRGVTFTNAYATTPLCCPSRASILTGLYAHHHGVLRNGGANGGWRAFDDSSTIATWLQPAGVRTMLVGKYLNLYASERVPPGWDNWFAIWDTGQKYYDYNVNDNGRIRFFGDKQRWYSTDILLGQATRLLKDDDWRPFLLYLAFDGPHAPATPARQDLKRFSSLPPQRLPSFNEQDVSDKPAWVQQLPLLSVAKQKELDDFRRAQIETLQAIDRAVGSVIDALRANGRLDETWLILMSDNGLSLGEHRYGRHKSCGYEECVRVPLIVVPPAARAATLGSPRSDSRLVLNVDIAPTLADLFGIAPGADVDGLSLARVLSDQQAGWRDDGLLSLWTDDDESDIAFQGVRSGRWKYLRYDNGDQELYDLELDPYELDNQAANPAQAARLLELSARVDALLR